MKTLIIINEKPDIDEKAYNAIRIAGQLQKDSGKNTIYVCLIADGVLCALSNNEYPKGKMNVTEMLANIIKQGAIVKMCTSCGEARKMMNKDLVAGVQWTNLKTLTDWISESNKIINY